MPSRYSNARPKRQADTFARTHHHDNENAEATDQGKFDLRNPSALAPDAQEEDTILEADVIGRSTAVKRGAVNIDGYDSDSDWETFDARAEVRHKKGRAKPEAKLADLLDQYEAKNDDAGLSDDGVQDDEDVEEQDDMFAAQPDVDMKAVAPVDDEDQDIYAPDPVTYGATERKDPNDTTKKKRKREVRFLGVTDITGQNLHSRDRTRISIGRHHEDVDEDVDEDESSEDSEDSELAPQEEDVDDEVGAGGLKRHAPRIEAFNIAQELEEGAFDRSGNYIRKAADTAATHDRWLVGVGKKDIRRAAAAHERRETDAQRRRELEEQIQTADLLDVLISQLEPAETSIEALMRLGKRRTQRKKGTATGKQRRLSKSRAVAGSMEESMEAIGVHDEEAAVKAEAEQTSLKEAINSITIAADGLLARNHPEIYDDEREVLMRLYRQETGRDWIAKKQDKNELEHQDMGGNGVKMWEYRWTDGRDGGQTQGPFRGAEMKAWQDAGYFGDGVEFRALGEQGGWTRAVLFDT